MSFILDLYRKQPELKRAPIVKRSLNSIHFERDQVGDQRVMQAFFRVKPVVAPINFAARAFQMIRSIGWRQTALMLAMTPLLTTLNQVSNAADARVYGQSTTYSSARSTSSSGDTGLTVFTVGQQFSSPTYFVYRSFLKFDTASLTLAASISQVNLSLTVKTNGSVTDFDVQIIKHDWSAQDPINSGGREESVFDNCLSGATDDNIWRNTSGISINTPYSGGNLNTVWINRTGNTYYSLRSSLDFSNTTPVGDEFINIASAENATSAHRPLLTVVYTLPGGGNIFQSAVDRSAIFGGTLIR